MLQIIQLFLFYLTPLFLPKIFLISKGKINELFNNLGEGELAGLMIPYFLECLVNWLLWASVVAISLKFGFPLHNHWLIPFLIFINFLILLVRNRGSSFNSFFKWPGKEYLPAYKLFVTGGIIFISMLLLNLLHPHFVYGEKGPDYQVLAYFHRNFDLPIQNLMAGDSLNRYYDLGPIIFGLMGKSFGMKPELTYHASTALIMSWSFLGVALVFQVIFSGIIKKGIWLWAAISSIVFFTQTNVAGFKGLLKNGILLQSYWDSSRVFDANNFAEYPFFTFSFLDLHPHLISFPFTVSIIITFLTLIFEWMKRRILRTHLISSVIFMGLSMVALNVWDGVVLFFLFVPIFLIVLVFMTKLNLNKRGAWDFGKWPVSLLMLTIGSTLAFACGELYRGREKSFLTMPLFRLHDGPGEPLLNLFYHQGHLWIIFVLFLIIGVLKFVQLKKQVNPLASNREFNWITSLWIALSFGATACYLNILSNQAVIFDRMNTLFKFRTWSYSLLALSALSLIGLNLVYFPRMWSRLSHRLHRLSLGLSLVLILFFSSLAVPLFLSLISYRPGPRGTLDGLLFLKHQSKGSADAVFWLDENELGAPMILEAPGNSFQVKDNLVSLYSGLPSLTGWEHHGFMRGAGTQRRAEGVAMTNFIYDSTDALRAHEFLHYFKIKYVVIGPNEKMRFGRLGLAKFNNFKNLFELVVSGPELQLYKVL